MLSLKLESINKQGLEAYIVGDINVDLFQYSSNKQTSDFLDMLFDKGFMPLITKATRITYHYKTLIDHIYTNTPENLIRSGVCLADISDHLPVFCYSASNIPPTNKETYYRDYSKFIKEKFLNDLNDINLISLVNHDVNESMNNIVDTLQRLTDKHEPVKKASNSMRRKLQKPWITRGMLKSIRKRYKLYISHFLSADSKKVKQYKTYSNKLNKIINIAKKQYYEAQFALYKANIKMTWKLIGTIVNRKRKNNITIPKLIYNNKCFTNRNDICNKLNEYFINVGPKLACQLPSISNADPTKYINCTLQSSFIFRSVSAYEVHDLMQGLNKNKSTIGIPIKCIKLASDYISEALALVFNSSFTQGIMPDTLKISKVTPVDKGGEHFGPTNYRTISTLSSISQIFEKLVYKQL